MGAPNITEMALMASILVPTLCIWATEFSLQANAAFLANLPARDISVELFTGNQSHFYGVDNTETFTAGYTLLNLGCGTGQGNRAGHEGVRLFFKWIMYLTKRTSCI